MKAVILLGTLKEKGRSNTETLAEFLGQYLAKQDIDYEIIRLAGRHIVAGTYTNMSVKDDWPEIYNKILDAKILLFATPIWWNNHSSEIQRCIERLDQVYDIILEGKDSPLQGKIGGVIVTGDSDGVEHITGNIANFFCSMGVTVPPYSALGVIWEGHSKGSKKTKAQLQKYYQRNYAKDAESMALSLKKAAR